ncbi:MAG: RHS repeat-associated core domain-containing protein, partial [Chlamydiia bacterium]|nr:RHS repeat-associated core domain-containing protein [Chlamydiia bacterium]
YAYDIQGNQIKKSIFQTQNTASTYTSKYNGDGTIQWSQDPLGHTTQWHYDHHHLNSLNQIVLKKTILDPLGRATIETEDAHHRIACRKIYEKERCVSSTEFFYDAAGHLTKELSQVINLTGSNQVLREYAVIRKYNNRGLLKSETEWPAEKKRRYTYDGMKRLIKEMKPDGVELSYTYDPLGNTETLISTDGTIHYEYLHDIHGNLRQAQDKVTGLIQTREFDSCDRLLTEEYNGIRISFEYDPLDRVICVHLPDQSSVTYIYNACHLKHAQRFDSKKRSLYSVSCESDLQGNLTHLTSPAGIIKTCFDLLQRPISIQSPNWQCTLDKFDPVGNLLQMTIEDPDGKEHTGFAYDRLNQLTEDSSFGNRFLYDSLGNCLSRNEQPQTNDALPIITKTAQGELHYDLNGNLKREYGKINYSYDALNRLITRDDQTGRTTFCYDALGRCVKIEEPSGTKTLLYHDMQEIGSISDSQLLEFRLSHPQQEQTLAIELDQKIYYPIQDPHRNISALQNPDGTLAQWARYSPFGEIALSGSLELKNPWRYANRREIAELVMFAYRFYHPGLIRWLTTDPIGFKDGLNLYRYVRNNPYSYRDPDGRFVFVIPLVVGTFGASGIVISGATIGTIAGTIAGTCLAIGVYQGIKSIDHQLDRGPKEPDEKENPTNGKPPRVPIPPKIPHENKKSAGSLQVPKEGVTNAAKSSGRNRFVPDANASGAHTVFRKDPLTNKVTHYETYRPQTNPFDPKPWESIKRYDGPQHPHKHYNKNLREEILTPHVHDPSCPGGIR